MLLLSALAAALAVTLWPFRFHFSLASFARIDWRLYYRGQHGQVIVDRDLVQNLALLSPVGAGWALLRGRRGVGRIALEAAVLGLGIAIGIETVQIFEPSRYPQVADVWRNSVGCAMASAVVAWLAPRMFRTTTSAPIHGLLARVADVPAAR